VFRLGQPVVNVGFGAGELERMSAKKLSLLKGKFDLDGRGGSIDSHQEIEFALLRLSAHLRDIDREVADRIGLELLPPGSTLVGLGQAGDAMPLKTAVPRRSGQLRDRRLERIKTVVEWQKRMSAEGKRSPLPAQSTEPSTSASVQSADP
jgi:hypothetical protein